jgi:hypothetical protein
MLALYLRARNRVEELVRGEEGQGLTVVRPDHRPGGGGTGGALGGLSRADRRRSEQYR